MASCTVIDFSTVNVAFSVCVEFFGDDWDETAAAAAAGAGDGALDVDDAVDVLDEIWSCDVYRRGSQNPRDAWLTAVVDEDVGLFVGAR